MKIRSILLVCIFTVMATVCLADPTSTPTPTNTPTPTSTPVAQYTAIPVNGGGTADNNASMLLISAAEVAKFNYIAVVNISDTNMYLYVGTVPAVAEKGYTLYANGGKFEVSRNSGNFPIGNISLICGTSSKKYTLIAY